MAKPGEGRGRGADVAPTALQIYNKSRAKKIISAVKMKCKEKFVNLRIEIKIVI